MDTAKRSANQVAAAILAELGLAAEGQGAAPTEGTDPNDLVTPDDAAALPDPAFGRPGG